MREGQNQPPAASRFPHRSCPDPAASSLRDLSTRAKVSTRTENLRSGPHRKIFIIVAIGPWGRNTGFWDADGLAGLRKPTLLMAGGADDVSVYPAMRQIFEEATGTNRHLLTFEGANHNAAAPMPAPLESWEPVETLDFVPFDHYADAVWDTNRMNNITQHFATAFMDLYLKADADKAMYFDLVERAADGVVDLDDVGNPTDAHSHWTGFAPRTGQGLTFETRAAGQ